MTGGMTGRGTGSCRICGRTGLSQGPSRLKRAIPLLSQTRRGGLTSLPLSFLRTRRGGMMRMRRRKIGMTLLLPCPAGIGTERRIEKGRGIEKGREIERGAESGMPPPHPPPLRPPRARGGYTPRSRSHTSPKGGLRPILRPRVHILTRMPVQKKAHLGQHMGRTPHRQQLHRTCTSAACLRVAAALVQEEGDTRFLRRWYV